MGVIISDFGFNWENSKFTPDWVDLGVILISNNNLIVVKSVKIDIQVP